MNLFNNFYTKVGLKVWGILCLVYSFLLTNFIWGNHDWDFLKTGVKLSDGFYEARYSHHLPSVLLFDGNLLPIFTLLFSSFALTCFSILVAKYLEFPKETKTYLLFSLFVGLNPHNFIIFYYLHYALQLYFWASCGVLYLYCFNKGFSYKKISLAILICVLLFGSYPPIFSLIFVLFIVRKIFDYLNKVENITNIFITSFLFIFVFTSAFIISKGVIFYLNSKGLYDGWYYNQQTKNLLEIINILPSELIKSFTQILSRYYFMNNLYIGLTSLLILTSIVLLFIKTKFNLLTILLFLSLFIVSRTIFIVAANADIAEFRLLYWSKLGIYIFAFATLYNYKYQILYNFLYVLLCLCIYYFVCLNFEIQKIMKISFISERAYYDRVGKRIIENDNFNIKEKYITFYFSQPVFSAKLVNLDDYINLHKFKPYKANTEIIGSNLSLDAFLIKNLFWDDVDYPIGMTTGVFLESNLFLFLAEDDYMKYKKTNKLAIKNWIYNTAKLYPHKDSIYIDDKHLILNLNNVFFNMYKDIFYNELDIKF